MLPITIPVLALTSTHDRHKPSLATPSTAASTGRVLALSSPLLRRPEESPLIRRVAPLDVGSYYTPRRLTPLRLVGTPTQGPGPLVDTLSRDTTRLADTPSRLTDSRLVEHNRPLGMRQTSLLTPFKLGSKQAAEKKSRGSLQPSPLSSGSVYQPFMQRITRPTDSQALSTSDLSSQRRILVDQESPTQSERHTQPIHLRTSALIKSLGSGGIEHEYVSELSTDRYRGASPLAKRRRRLRRPSHNASMHSTTSSTSANRGRLLAPRRQYSQQRDIGMTDGTSIARSHSAPTAAHRHIPSLKIPKDTTTAVSTVATLVPSPGTSPPSTPSMSPKRVKKAKVKRTLEVLKRSAGSVLSTGDTSAGDLSAGGLSTGGLSAGGLSAGGFSTSNLSAGGESSVASRLRKDPLRPLKRPHRPVGIGHTVDIESWTKTLEQTLAQHSKGWDGGIQIQGPSPRPSQTRPSPAASQERFSATRAGLIKQVTSMSTPVATPSRSPADSVISALGPRPIDPTSPMSSLLSWNEQIGDVQLPLTIKAHNLLKQLTHPSVWDNSDSDSEPSRTPMRPQPPRPEHHLIASDATFLSETFQSEWTHDASPKLSVVEELPEAGLQSTAPGNVLTANVLSSESPSLDVRSGTSRAGVSRTGLQGDLRNGLPPPGVSRYVARETGVLSDPVPGAAVSIAAREAESVTTAGALRHFPAGQASPTMSPDGTSVAVFPRHTPYSSPRRDFWSVCKGTQQVNIPIPVQVYQIASDTTVEIVKPSRELSGAKTLGTLGSHESIFSVSSAESVTSFIPSPQETLDATTPALLSRVTSTHTSHTHQTSHTSHTPQASHASHQSNTSQRSPRASFAETEDSEIFLGGAIPQSSRKKSLVRFGSIGGRVSTPNSTQSLDSRDRRSKRIRASSWNTSASKQKINEHVKSVIVAILSGVLEDVSKKSEGERIPIDLNTVAANIMSISTLLNLKQERGNLEKQLTSLSSTWAEVDTHHRYLLKQVEEMKSTLETSSRTPSQPLTRLWSNTSTNRKGFTRHLSVLPSFADDEISLERRPGIKQKLQWVHIAAVEGQPEETPPKRPLMLLTPPSSTSSNDSHNETIECNLTSSQWLHPKQKKKKSQLSLAPSVVDVEIQCQNGLRALKRLKTDGRVIPGLPPTARSGSRSRRFEDENGFDALSSLWHTRAASTDQSHVGQDDLGTSDAELKNAVKSWVAARASAAFSASYRRIYGQNLKEFRGVEPPMIKPHLSSNSRPKIVAKASLKVPMWKAFEEVAHLSPSVESQKPGEAPGNDSEGPRDDTEGITLGDTPEKRSEAMLGDGALVGTPGHTGSGGEKSESTSIDDLVTKAKPDVEAALSSSAAVKKAPPVSSKKAPPPSKKKAPLGKKPPPGKKPPGGAATVVSDPYVPTPPSDLKPRVVNWSPLVDAKISGTIWDGLLDEEAKWPTATEAFATALARAQAQIPHYRLPSTDNPGISVSARVRSSVVPAPRRSSLNPGNSPGSQQYPWDRGPTTTYVKCRFEPDYQTIINLFFEDEAAIQARKLGNKVASQTKLQYKGILDSRRLHILEISLKGLGIYHDWDSVRRSILELDLGLPQTSIVNPDFVTQYPSARRLDATECSVLLGLLPTPDEEAALKMAAPDDLAKAEVTILEWQKISRFKQRVECCVTLQSYQSEVDKLSQRQARQLEVLDALHEIIVDPPALKALLGLCLRTGNFLNFHTNKKAKGVAVGSFETLKKVNSIDGSTNLLRVVAELLDNQFPSVWVTLEEGLKGCSEISQMNPDERTAQIKQMEESLRKVRVEVTDFMSEHDSRFLEVMTRFVDGGASILRNLREQNEEIVAKLMLRAKQFNPSTSATQDALDVMAKLGAFWNDLVTARDQAREKVIRQHLQSLRKSRLRTISSVANLPSPTNEKVARVPGM
eukprot:Blabericola_migrator_1__10904@NODE_629_length_7167_cov_75_872535_g460_i0_p1_GENE_NODE_629_length_7167_cov_75_872535_g460_i0NODE_629_length_7167_cov_75_872535_g460_i0_p1_ORF_typecomplete_len1913_score341_66FH2/PF02181_23/1_5e03FH2/PF02181_23/1_6e45RasGAP_C/PF03836_15/0_03Prominin/PF05478_11/0_37Prominin/PF05478_11/38HIP1_clath_bdg/PF16515_5/2_6HIP1_clath_bdg/PF16515_5/9e03HIP1_clath_bdg/PF16515_5/76Mod_r/PF07200_13/8_7e02Mod_r/PF07200_13/0_61_NODE_629_length_7167_cov_75_872535_g460_i02345972